MTTLENSYCRPNEEQYNELSKFEPGWLFNTLCGYRNGFAVMVEYGKWDGDASLIDMDEDQLEGRKEVPAGQFIDLLHRKITPWRLEEIQLNLVAYASDGGSAIYGKNINDCAIMVTFPIDGSHPIVEIMTVEFHDRMLKLKVYVEDFSNLLTQIKFLTPPTK